MALSLSACARRAHLDINPHNASWRHHQTQVRQVPFWHVTGKLAAKGLASAGQVNFDWQQMHDDYQIDISGPFGLGRVQLIGRPTEVKLLQGRRTLTARSLDALIHQALNMQIPVEGLRYWIRGLPQPNVEIQALVLDPNNRISSLMQEGWSLEIAEYQRVGKLDLPRKLNLQRGELSLKLIVKTWQ